jgi:hypothetical protein
VPRGLRALAIAAAVAAVAPAGPARAGEWEVEVHGGVLWTLMPSGGRATTLPASEPFPTVVPGVSSRRVTSWYFGDGGTLLEQSRTVWGSSTGSYSYTYQYTVTAGTLDRVLSSAAIGQPLGGGAGLRLGRRLGRRLTAEIDVEYGGHSPTFSENARADIDSSRASFGDTWSDMLSSLPGSSVTSQAAVRHGTGRRLIATGVLNVNLQTGDAPKWSRRSPSRRFVSYLTFGAGIVSTAGEEAAASLVGRYRFASPGEPGAPFEETDTVSVRSSGTLGTAFVGVVGVGWKQDLSTRWGLRFDARAYLSRNTTRIALDARPSVTPGSPASAYVTDSRAGAIQFVNERSGPYAGDPSSLSGPPIAGLETFTGSGMLAQISVTLGVFLRF